MKKHVTIGIMMSLLSGKKYTAKMLADKYETSVKTIYRAIDTLLEAGMPICSISGKNGGYELIQESKINSSFFTTSELCSFISFIKSNNKDLCLSNDNSLDERLFSTINTNLSEQLKNGCKQLVIDSTIWCNNEYHENIIETIESSIKLSRKISIEYLNIKNKKSEIRIVHPYTLVFKMNAWYLYAYCETRKAFRLFKLTRIENINKLSEYFKPINIDTLSKPWNKDFKNNLEEITIDLLCNKCFVKDVKSWLGNNIQINSTINQEVIISGKAHLSNGLIHRIMEFGNNITILKPNKLINLLKKECLNIYNNYEKNAI